VFASLGRFCFRRRRLVVGLWLLAVLAGFALGTRVFGSLGTDYSGTSIESFQAYDHLERSATVGTRLTAVVDGRPVDDPQVRRAVERARADLMSLDGVAQVADVYAAPLPALRATDGRASLLTVDLDADSADSLRAGATEDEVVDAVVERLHAIEQDAGEGTDVLVGGTVLLNREINEQTQRDVQRGEMVALPLTLLVMIVIFGGFVAASLPVLGAIASIAGGFATLYAFSTFMTLDPTVPTVTTVMGLGLSIDYSLLLISRYREERARGLDPEDATVAMMATAGRTVLFSALTIAASLSGLFVFKIVIFRALGAAGVGVVVVALLAALTLVPALVAMFGRRIKVPTSPVPDEGFFSRLAHGTQRRAWLTVIGVSALLALAGSPFLNANFVNGGAELLPSSFESRQFADTLSSRFPSGGVEPVIVVAQAPVADLAAYGESVRELAGVESIGPVEQRLDGWASLEILPAGDSQGGVAQDLVHDLRDNRPEFRTWVTGDAAILVDFKASIAERVPLAAAIVAFSTFVLLFLMTGSVLVPLKALVMNTLSLGATFGLLVWVSQEGNGSDLLGFTPTGGIETWIPVVVFAFAFGLSMDYEVFLLSRIKELYDAGLSNDEAVRRGLQRSGRIITCAALLIVIVFLGFATGEMLGIKELGVALAVAVAVDATIVRCLLVPATMTLLGDWNWWAPGPLRRLHDRFGLREHAAPAELAPKSSAGEAVRS
jgi:RND superfamily putative drug exporter